MAATGNEAVSLSQLLTLKNAIEGEPIGKGLTTLTTSSGAINTHYVGWGYPYNNNTQVEAIVFVDLGRPIDSSVSSLNFDQYLTFYNNGISEDTGTRHSESIWNYEKGIIRVRVTLDQDDGFAPGAVCLSLINDGYLDIYGN